MTTPRRDRRRSIPTRSARLFCLGDVPRMGHPRSHLRRHSPASAAFTTNSRAARESS